MLATVLSLVLAATFPAYSPTGWMNLDAFRLSLGMPRAQAVANLKELGLGTRAGSDGDLIVDYQETRALTLSFRDDRMTSARFELVTFMPEVKPAFRKLDEELTKQRGPARRLSDSALSWETGAPRVMVVMSTARGTQLGKQGLGFVVVRYFEPPAE